MAVAQGYRPQSPPTTTDTASVELSRWAFHELETVARSMQNMTWMQLEVLHVALERPREGIIVCADGTNWNPGAGGGFYGYHGGAWNKLG